MGRYSSVQAYADNHAGVRKVPYEQAAARPSGGGASDKPAVAAVRPEKVVNPYGSTAGAGSGEFHVYRHARNREMKRQHDMEQTAQEQQAEEQFQREQEANRRWEEERTAKRRRKRERQKNAKKRKENLVKAGIISDSHNNSNNNNDDDDDGEEEFTYTPGEAIKPLAAETNETSNTSSTRNEETLPHMDLPPNDGSFLEMMKQKLAQQQQSSSSSNTNTNNDNVETEQETGRKRASEES